MKMNKDYKLMAALIPVILILSVTLYLFPDSSGISTQIQAPLLNQTNNTTVNQTTTNQTATDTQTQTNTQNSQSTTSGSGNSYYNSNQGSYNGNSNSGNSSYYPSEPSTPTDNSTYY